MGDELAVSEVDRESIISKLVLRGDMSQLRPTEKVAYYVDFCKALGLNPITRPFEYIQMKGKDVLYATKRATDQLRKRDNIAVVDTQTTQMADVYIVKTKVRNSQGRTDVSIGAVDISGLNGEDLANALMKAETKAKRRATLSICGLGMLDETEISDIADAHIVSDVELDEGKQAINKLIEDNQGLLDDDFIVAQTIDMDEAYKLRDIDSLRLVYSEIKEVSKKDRNKETKQNTKDVVASMQTPAEDAIEKMTEPELDIF